MARILSRLLWLGLIVLVDCSGAGDLSLRPPFGNPRAEVYRELSSVPWVNLKEPPRPEDLAGRVILLDFWTFCCINCMHVIPDLHRLETEFGDRLTVLGIHSAKFENEKESAQISMAIEKYGVTHPVANDSNFRLWNYFDVNAWPTFVLIDADGNTVHRESGEGVYGMMRDRIAREIAKAEKKQGRANRPPFVLTTPRPDAKRLAGLFFPSRILIRDDRIFLSDSGNHRILILSLNGRIEKIIGSGEAGFVNGPARTARFHSPQGLEWRNGILYIADTENHAIRTYTEKTDQVKTLAGDGRQAFVSWRDALSTELSSPWDIKYYEGSLWIAMAGTHQIYRLTDGGLQLAAGTGEEGIRDGRAETAALAQTGGLSPAPDGRLFFVDSETSSLRFYDRGTIRTVIGKGLFDFGLKDGKMALLQHPLGLFATNDEVFIADTYNHAIRRFDRKGGVTETIAGGRRGYRDGKSKDALFNEPNDIFRYKGSLYVVDTNNHAIRIMGSDGTVQTLKLEFPSSAR